MNASSRHQVRRIDPKIPEDTSPSLLGVGFQDVFAVGLECEPGTLRHFGFELARAPARVTEQETHRPFAALEQDLETG